MTGIKSKITATLLSWLMIFTMMPFSFMTTEVWAHEGELEDPDTDYLYVEELDGPDGDYMSGEEIENDDSDYPVDEDVESPDQDYPDIEIEENLDVDHVNAGELMICGMDILNGNHDDVNNTYTIDDGAGGTAVLSYDLNNKPVLTLTGINYAGDGYRFDEDYDETAAIYYTGVEPLTLVPEGENTIILNGNHSRSYGIYTSKANLILNGTGSLIGTVTLSSATQIGYGLNITGDVIVTAGTLNVTVDIAEGVNNTKSNYGLYCAKDVKVSGGNLILHNKGYSHGIKNTGNIEVTGGVLTATGGNYGIESNGKVTVSDGELTAACDGKNPNSSYGIKCYGVSVTGGIVTATASKGGGTGDTTASHGIFFKRTGKNKWRRGERCRR